MLYVSERSLSLDFVDNLFSSLCKKESHSGRYIFVNDKRHYVNLCTRLREGQNVPESFSTSSINSLENIQVYTSFGVGSSSFTCRFFHLSVVECTHLTYELLSTSLLEVEELRHKI